MSVKIITADVFDGLADMPDGSVQCVVTSPPYWGLRDYGIEGQIGLEPTLGDHLDLMVCLFEEVRRVLRPDGTVWLNYGDSYANDGKWGGTTGGKHASGLHGGNGLGRQKVKTGLKPKDLCMLPNRLAIALQEAGWWVRSEIIWAKPNPMPESIKDRPATSHEKIFLLTKSARYAYYRDAARQNFAQDEMANGFRGGSYTGGTPGKRTTKGNWKVPDGWDTGPGAHGSIHKRGRDKGEKADKQRGHGRRHDGFNDRWDLMTKEEQQASGRNLRNYEPEPMQVWKIATRPFKEAHFATFPPELVERCLLAGTKLGDLVLDPFGGAGTTGLVAAQMGREAVLIEKNPAYVDIASKRLRTELIRVESDAVQGDDDGPLFTDKFAEAVS